MAEVFAILFGGVIFFGALILLFVVPIVIMRWVLRTNDQINLLTDIRTGLNKLIELNSKKGTE